MCCCTIGDPLTKKRDVVRSRLLEMIEQLPVGSALPPERRLAAMLEVSRSTLRDVIEDLAAAGYLEPRQGSGTYVRQPRVLKQLGLNSFSEDMRRRNAVPSSRILTLERRPAGKRLGNRMGVPAETVVWRLVRLRFADGQPMAVESAHVPVGIVAEITAAMVEGRSLYELIEAQHHSGFDHAVQQIQAVLLPADKARLLSVPEHSAALHFDRLAYCEDDHLLEYTTSLYRADRYIVTAELHRTRLRT